MGTWEVPPGSQPLPAGVDNSVGDSMEVNSNACKKFPEVHANVLKKKKKATKQSWQKKKIEIWLTIWWIQREPFKRVVEIAVVVFKQNEPLITIYNPAGTSAV